MSALNTVQRPIQPAKPSTGRRIVSAKFFRTAAFCGCAAALAGCTDPKGAKDTAEAQGLTDVHVGGYSAWGCDEKDTYHTSFTARGANGKCVEGVVCSGILKGSTLRITGAAVCGVAQ